MTNLWYAFLVLPSTPFFPTPMLSLPIPQSDPSDNHASLSVCELLHKCNLLSCFTFVNAFPDWHKVLSNLNLSMDNTTCLCHFIQNQAYFLYDEKEVPQLQHKGQWVHMGSGAQLMQFVPNLKSLYCC